jgi:hypothetical protein
MKKANRKADEMREEYDLSGGIRGKYIARLNGKRVILLEPDVAERFSNSDSVNQALRLLMKAGAEAIGSQTASREKAS